MSSPHAHDRVVMPSRRADGTLDQTDPELIGPVDDALVGVEHQLQSQAAAALDETVQGTYDAVDGERMQAAVGETATVAQAEVRSLHPEA